MTGFKFRLKDFEIDRKTGKPKRKMNFARSLAAKKAAASRKRFVKATKGLNQP